MKELLSRIVPGDNLWLIMAMEMVMMMMMMMMMMMTNIFCGLSAVAVLGFSNFYDSSACVTKDL
jgi:hypothetical protein